MLVVLGVAALVLLAMLGAWWFRRQRVSSSEAEDALLAAEETLRPVLPHGMTGSYREIEYRVAVSPQRVAALSFALHEPLVNPLEVDARAGFEPISELTRGLDVRALIAMGANYIDIGATEQQVRIEFPPGPSPFGRADVERILSHLLRLRDLSSD